MSTLYVRPDSPDVVRVPHDDLEMAPGEVKVALRANGEYRATVIFMPEEGPGSPLNKAAMEVGAQLVGSHLKMCGRVKFVAPHEVLDGLSSGVSQ